MSHPIRVVASLSTLLLTACPNSEPDRAQVTQEWQAAHGATVAAKAKRIRGAGQLLAALPPAGPETSRIELGDPPPALEQKDEAEWNLAVVNARLFEDVSATLSSSFFVDVAFSNGNWIYTAVALAERGEGPDHLFGDNGVLHKVAPAFNRIRYLLVVRELEYTKAKIDKEKNSFVSSVYVGDAQLFDLEGPDGPRHLGGFGFGGTNSDTIDVGSRASENKIREDMRDKTRAEFLRVLKLRFPSIAGIDDRFGYFAIDDPRPVDYGAWRAKWKKP